jgi:DNA polymerase-3 subunit epsilon
MRHIILDTETTGLHPNQGDRIVEIGCIELENRRPTGKTLHFYMNPERDMPEAAAAIHGLRSDFLADKPIFASVAQEISAFIKEAHVVIHNAPFDLGFLDMEYQRMGKPPFTQMISGVVDTLIDAQRMFPGKRNRLDDLCQRFGIRNDHRKLHGALLDAELLADVFLAMTRGQNDLGMDHPQELLSSQMNLQKPLLPTDLKVLLANDTEIHLHEQLLQEIAKKSKQPPSWLQ